MKVVQSADLLAVLFSELDLLDDAAGLESEVVLLPFAPAEDDTDSDLLVLSDLDVSVLVDSVLDESALLASALLASTLEVSPFDLA
jgi:hypothetical protein